jgi:mannitol/fructose-specific phosphotransferase system IIA component (Ntr-type)
MKLVDLVVKDAIVPELKAQDRDGVIRELVKALADAKAINASDADTIVKAILDREKHPLIKKRVGAIGRSSAGVDFASLDSAPVYSVFLLLSPKDNPDGHLQAMEKVFSNLQQDNFRRFLRQSDTRQKIVDLLEEADQAAAGR